MNDFPKIPDYKGKRENFLDKIIVNYPDGLSDVLATFTYNINKEINPRKQQITCVTLEQLNSSYSFISDSLEKSSYAEINYNAFTSTEQKTTFTTYVKHDTSEIIYPDGYSQKVVSIANATHAIQLNSYDEKDKSNPLQSTVYGAAP